MSLPGSLGTMDSMKNDHANGQPVPAESPVITETLRRLRNRSPSESLGLPSSSGMMRPFVQASIVTAVLLALLTVLPYFLDKGKTADAKVTVPTGDKQEPADAPKQPNPETTAKTAPGTKADTKADIVSKLGENAAKTAPAKVNPLDKKDDDILKDIK